MCFRVFATLRWQGRGGFSPQLLMSSFHNMFSFSFNSHPVHGPSEAQGIAHVSEVTFWRNLLLEASYLALVKPGPPEQHGSGRNQGAQVRCRAFFRWRQSLLHKPQKFDLPESLIEQVLPTFWRLFLALFESPSRGSNKSLSGEASLGTLKLLEQQQMLQGQSKHRDFG